MNLKRIIFLLSILLSVLLFNQTIFSTECRGHFVNPITDICWDCLFPITIGHAAVVKGSLPDTPNPSLPVCLCPAGIAYRLGVTIGFWEPFALVDVTRDPYCMVNLGLKLDVKDSGLGGSEMPAADGRGSFYYVHWYKYPLIYWLQVITSVACMQKGDFDVAYLTELDPTWNDDELSFVLNPEASLFSTPIARASCFADASKTMSNHVLPIDKLFWCMGSEGSTYPLTGNVASETSPIQAATLLAERMDYKLHRQGIIWDSVGENSPAICHTYPSAIMPKSRYRYQMTNVLADATSCHPFGHTVTSWEIGHNYPSEGNNFGFLIWRKRNCCFL